MSRSYVLRLFTPNSYLHIIAFQNLNKHTPKYKAHKITKLFSPKVQQDSENTSFGSNRHQTWASQRLLITDNLWKVLHVDCSLMETRFEFITRSTLLSVEQTIEVWHYWRWVGAVTCWCRETEPSSARWQQQSAYIQMLW